MPPPATSRAVLKELADEDSILFPIEVRRYHRMIREGILPEGEPLELLAGQLVRKDRSASGEDPLTVGHAHAWVIGQLADLNPKLRRLGCHVRVQQPLTLPPLDEPEPDATVVLGSNADYRDRHPSASDVTCVIEVADSSLRRDRTIKQRIYATAQIPTYILINLKDRVIEVMTDPTQTPRRARYRSSETLSRTDELKIPAAGAKSLRIAARQLLG